MGYYHIAKKYTERWTLIINDRFLTLHNPFSSETVIASYIQIMELTWWQNNEGSGLFFLIIANVNFAE